MRTDRQCLGQKGEELAVQYLLQKGYTILERNLRIRRAEIDIVCLENNDLVLVEVKSVRTPHWGYGEERISNKKKKMLIQAGYAFLDLNPDIMEKNMRFDVIVIDFSSYPAAIKHYQGAFWQTSADCL